MAGGEKAKSSGEYGEKIVKNLRHHQQVWVDINQIV